MLPRPVGSSKEGESARCRTRIMPRSTALGKMSAFQNTERRERVGHGHSWHSGLRSFRVPPSRSDAGSMVWHMAIMGVTEGVSGGRLPFRFPNSSLKFDSFWVGINIVTS